MLAGTLIDEYILYGRRKNMSSFLEIWVEHVVSIENLPKDVDMNTVEFDPVPRASKNKPFNVSC